MTCDPHPRAADLLRRLAPQRWPVPPAALPPGTALVGGAVRDALLDRLGERPDLDLVVPGDAIALGQALARRHGGSCVVLDRERSIARLVLRGWTLDLARCQGGSLEADLGRRDYTVNAIGLPLDPSGEGAGPAEAGQLVDPHDGLGDLAAARMEAIREENLLDDPLRLLRGVRLATELGFVLTPRTRAWIGQHHRHLGAVAGERVLAELERLAAAPRGGAGLAEVLQLGLLVPWGVPPPTDTHDFSTGALAQLVPERARERGLTADETASALPLARLASVLSRAALERLRASRRLQQRCQRLRRWWRQLADGGGGLGHLDEAQRLELHRDLEEDLPALLLHLPAGEAAAALERWRDPADPLFHPRPPLDGRSLQQALGLAPGPLLGELIDHLTRERAFGRLPAAEVPPIATLGEASRWLAGRGEGSPAADRNGRRRG